MNCKYLHTIYAELLDNDFLQLVASIAYVVNKCIGRVRLSKELAISERSARNLVEKLCAKGVISCVVNKCINEDLFKELNLETKTIYDRRITVLSNVDKELLKLVENHIVDLRDYIIMILNDPYSLEIIGYTSENGFISIPRVPTNYYRKYLQMLSTIKIPESSIFVLWSKYRKYYCESSLVHGLYHLCTRYTGELRDTSR